MRRPWPRIVMLATSIALLGCSSATEPGSSIDVDTARARWLALRPSAYSFDVAPSSSWFPATGYYHVEVSAGQVVAARNPAGQTVADFTLTVDRIWDELLAARAINELNATHFDLRGVPLETDMGPWPVDGGRHYSVRNFAAK
jgi:Family of unknown function (DUF6174)